jgi:beta-alanine degradation protein BauB
MDAPGRRQDLTFGWHGGGSWHNVPFAKPVEPPQPGVGALSHTKSLLRGVAAGLLFAASPLAPAQDPAVVNVSLVRVTLDNDRVRVFEVVLPPGEKEQLHSHPAYVVHVLAGGRIRNHAADGRTSESELATGETIYREPLIHWAENIGTTTIRLIVVELKDAR